jgi:hypothetical protein
MPADQTDAPRGREALVVFTHLLNPSVRELLMQLAEQLAPSHDLWVTGYFGPGADGALDVPSGWPSGWRFHPVFERSVRALPYPVKLQGVRNWEGLRGNVDLPLLAFFGAQPGYERYWFMEYDVRYSGSWAELFAGFSAVEADLLCTHLTRRGREDGWFHWPGFVAPGFGPEQHVRGFLPLCRASARLLRAIDARYRNGWSGHPEAVWPTVAKAEGMPFEDIGGSGPFTPPSRKGRYYFSQYFQNGVFLSTFSAWPAYSAESDFRGHSRPERKDILWHPVK